MHLPQPVEGGNMQQLQPPVQREQRLRGVRVGLRHLPELLPDLHRCGELQRAGELRHRQHEGWVHVLVPKLVDWSIVRNMSHAVRGND